MVASSIEANASDGNSGKLFWRNVNETLHWEDFFLMMNFSTVYRCSGKRLINIMDRMMYVYLYWVQDLLA